MILDLNEAPPGEARRGYDVCILGAGVAGITLASQLAARGRRVLLLEAGGLEFSAASQDLYKGENLGRPYFALDEARLRYLGGTSNHWQGWCRPLDAWDFARHDHIPLSGWPIAKRELERQLERASRILEIPAAYDDRELAESDGAFSEIGYRISTPVYFGEKYLAELRDSRRIDLVVNANVVDIRLDEAGERVSEVVCANYADSAARFRFAGARVVLAMGGIENPRMLLNCRSQQVDGLGNAKDLVGRCFMEHFHAFCGYYATEREAWPFGAEESHLAPTPAFLEARQIANAGLRLGPLTGPDAETGFLRRAKQRVVCAEDAVREFVASFTDPRCLTHVYVGGYLHVASEQVPNPESRVTLSGEADRFGLRRPALDWRITPLDRRTIRESVVGLGSFLAARGYGNVKLADWLLDDAAQVPAVGEDRWFGAGWHHMGTTRMAETPEEGVVDPDCRVFGIDNLYLAGSSVFPTGGHANPTLTIVQLALRLGEHLDRRLGA